MSKRKNPDPDRDFVITREFNAPRALVWKAWTDPRQMAQWWGSHGFMITIGELDAKPGGIHSVVMRSPEGVDYPVKGVYQVVEPALIVMTLDTSGHPAEWQNLVNANGGSGSENAAGEMVQTVTFEEVGKGTQLTICTRFESTSIRDAMLKMGMSEGWSESLERLDVFLAEASVGSIYLEVKHHFQDSAETVFDAWLDPVTAGQWLFATSDGEMIRVEIDARVGGAFTIVEKRGETFAGHFGNYVAIDRPRRLAFTFATDRKQKTTHVTVAIVPVDQGCELTLTHEMDAQWADYADRTQAGWTRILEGLATSLEANRKT